MEKCNECRVEIVPGMTSSKQDFGQTAYEASLPANCCPSCGTSFISADDWELLEMSIAKAVVICSERGRTAFRYCRHALGIGNAEMSDFFGASTIEVQQYFAVASAGKSVPDEWWEKLAKAVMAWEPPNGKTLPDCTVTRTHH